MGNERRPLGEKEIDLYLAYRARIEEFLHIILLYKQLHENGPAPDNDLGHGAREFKETLFIVTTGWLASLVDKNRSALNVFDMWLTLFPEKRDEIEAERDAFGPFLNTLYEFRHNVAFHANKSWQRQEAIRVAVHQPGMSQAIDGFMKLLAAMLRAEASRPELASVVSQRGSV